MAKIVLDANVFVAFVDENDTLHARAMVLLPQIPLPHADQAVHLTRPQAQVRCQEKSDDVIATHHRRRQAEPSLYRNPVHEAHPSPPDVRPSPTVRPTPWSRRRAPVEHVACDRLGVVPRPKRREFLGERNHQIERDLVPRRDGREHDLRPGGEPFDRVPHKMPHMRCNLMILFKSATRF